MTDSAVHIRLDGIGKTYVTRQGRVDALQTLDLAIGRGRIFGIIGRSGAGKSSLIRLLNRLEKPTMGRVLVDGQDLALLDEKSLSRFRRRIGMIFQHFNLHQSKTVSENVALPLRLAGLGKDERQARVADLLQRVGLADKAEAYPAQLSGGQKQRVGIARALALQPEILLCDEATSALDPESTQSILQLLREINRELGLTLVLITHEMEVIRDLCDEVAVLEQGRLIEQGEVWQVFGNPAHATTRQLLNGSLPDTAAQQATSAASRRLHLVFTGASGHKPDVQAIAAGLQQPVELVSSSIRPIQGRSLGYLTLELVNPLDEDAWQDLLQRAAGLADRVEVSAGR